jgi:uncharacterized protein YdgA (DUF945 family)
MMTIYSNPAALSADANPAAMMEPLSKPVLKLLEYNPEISLDRISFRSPQGEVMIAARAKFNDVKPEDFKQPPILVTKLDASADISLPESLLMTPFGAKAESAQALQMQMQMRREQITALAEQGYITRDGTMARSRLEFRNGQFAVNGRPFDPTVMQAQVPRPSQPPRPQKPGKKRLVPAR